MDVAKEVGADAVSHGCTGKGNDQVCMPLHRYLAMSTLFPDEYNWYLMINLI